MRVIELTRGQVAIVDDDTFESLAQYRWHFNGRYGVRWSAAPTGQRKLIYMHRVIMGLAPGRKPEVDHRNLNGLDNRRENLRLATRHQNAWNVPTMKGKWPPFKGVTFDTHTMKYRAQICAYSNKTELGRFDTVEEACAAYKNAAENLHGEFARLQ